MIPLTLILIIQADNYLKGVTTNEKLLHKKNEKGNEDQPLNKFKNANSSFHSKVSGKGEE